MTALIDAPLLFGAAGAAALPGKPPLAPPTGPPSPEEGEMVAAALAANHAAQDEPHTQEAAPQRARRDRLLSDLVTASSPVTAEVSTFRECLRDFVVLVFPRHGGARFVVPINALRLAARDRLAGALGRPDFRYGPLPP
jgi:hypothetical protein